MVHWRLIGLMQSSELIDFINLFPSLAEYFKGICSISTIPKYLKINHFLIVNTEPAHLPGEHWFCLIKRKSQFEYFDSLGVTTRKLDILKENLYLRKNIEIKFNETAVQSNDSISCGKFVLYFIVQRMFNLDLSYMTLLNDIFSENVEENERIIQKFFADHLIS